MIQAVHYLQRYCKEDVVTHIIRITCALTFLFIFRELTLLHILCLNVTDGDPQADIRRS